MPELRDTATDRPDDRPAETRDPIDVHRLPPGYEPPEGSGLAKFAQRVADLPWECAGNKKKGT
jgi:hypothetical protein